MRVPFRPAFLQRPDAAGPRQRAATAIEYFNTKEAS